MTKTVVLEFDNAHDADALVESIHEYNHGVLVEVEDGDSFRRVYPSVSGVYTKVYAIEGTNELD